MEAIFADYELTAPHNDVKTLIRDACLAAGYQIAEVTDIDREGPGACMLHAEEGTWDVIADRGGAAIRGNGVNINIEVP